MDRNKLEIVGTPYLIGIPERIRFYHHTKRIHQRQGAPIVSVEKMIGRFFPLNDQIKIPFIPRCPIYIATETPGRIILFENIAGKMTLVKIKQQTIQAKKTFT